MQLAQKCGLHARGHGAEAGEVADGDHRVAVAGSMPDEVRNLCRLADITAKSTLLQIVRQADPQENAGPGREAGRPGRSHAPGGRAKRPPSQSLGGPKSFVFAFKPPTKAFDLRLSFKKTKVETGRDHRGAREHHPRAASRQPGSKLRPEHRTDRRASRARRQRPSKAAGRGWAQACGSGPRPESGRLEILTRWLT